MQNFEERNIKNKRALTIAEVAQYACVSENTVRNWIVSDLISYEELSGRGNGSHKFRLIRKNDFDDFLDKHYHQPSKLKDRKSFNEIVLLPKEDI